MPPLTIVHPHKQFSAHPAYVCEVSAHWISAHFRRDVLRLPQNVGEALDAAEHDGAWVRRRSSYPYALNRMDESHTGTVACCT